MRRFDFSVVDLGQILNQSAFSLDHCTDIDPSLLEEEEEEEACEDENCTEEHDHKHEHGHGHADAAAGDAEAAEAPKKRKKKRHDLSQVVDGENTDGCGWCGDSMCWVALFFFVFDEIAV